MTISSLLPALIAAKAKIGPATKNATNNHLGNRYADVAAVLDAVEDPLHEHGLVIVQTTEVDQGHLTLVTRLYHQSGEFIEGKMPVVMNKGSAQDMGSGLTYARRYAILAMLSIRTEDDDGEVAVGRGGRRDRDDRPSQPTQPPRPRPTPPSTPPDPLKKLHAMLGAKMKWRGETEDDRRAEKMHWINMCLGLDAEHSHTTTRSLNDAELSAVIATLRAMPDVNK